MPLKDMLIVHPLSNNWLSFALREINKKEAVQAYREERMTIRQCADMLGVDYFEINEILSSENVPIVSESKPDIESLPARIKDSFNVK